MRYQTNFILLFFLSLLNSWPNLFDGSLRLFLFQNTKQDFIICLRGNIYYINRHCIHHSQYLFASTFVNNICLANTLKLCWKLSISGIKHRQSAILGWIGSIIILLKLFILKAFKKYFSKNDDYSI